MGHKNKLTKLLVVAVLIILLIPVGGGTVAQSGDPLGFLTGYRGGSSYHSGPTGCLSRRVVTIDNSSNPESLADYQVKLDVVYLSGMSTDFSDLRFTTFSGYDLDYWVESYTASTEATVWIEVDSIPANDSVDIIMWYDSCIGGSPSNGDDTFLLFDDFSDGTYTDKWIPAGTVTENGGVLKLSGCHNSSLHSLTAVLAPVILETRTRQVFGADTRTNLRGDLDIVSFGMGANWGTQYCVEKGGPNFGSQTVFLDASSSAWKEYRAILDDTTFQVYRGSQLDTWERDDSLTLDSSSDGMAMHAQLYAHATYCTEGEWDWVRVRKHTEVEPIATVGDSISTIYLPLVLRLP